MKVYHSDLGGAIGQAALISRYEGSTTSLVSHECTSRLAHRALSARRAVAGWARLGSNQGPPACEAGALPLSYAPRDSKSSGLIFDEAVDNARSDPLRCRVDIGVRRAAAIACRSPGRAPTPAARSRLIGMFRRRSAPCADSHHSATRCRLDNLRVAPPCRRGSRLRRTQSAAPCSVACQRPAVPRLERERLDLCRHGPPELRRKRNEQHHHERAEPECLPGIVGYDFDSRASTTPALANYVQWEPAGLQDVLQPTETARSASRYAQCAVPELAASMPESNPSFGHSRNERFGRSTLHVCENLAIGLATQFGGPCVRPAPPPSF